MKIRSLLLSALALSFAVCGCTKGEPLPEGDPSISLSKEIIDFEKNGAPQTISVTSNRQWAVEKNAEWITVSPSEGKASVNACDVTISVDENAGEERSATVTFTTGSASAVLTVNQDGIPVAHGDGSFENPYSASEAYAVAAKLDAATSVPAYVKGIISTIKSIETGSYGNAEYCISDDGKAENEFIIYRGYFFDGAKFTSEDQIKKGDSVVVFGDIVNFKGNTPEMTSGSRIVTLNGETPEPPAPPTPITGDNLLDNPGFETWSGDAPSAWKEISSNATVEQSTDSRSGSYSAKVTGDSSGKSNQRLMSRKYALKAGKYQLGVYSKGDGQIRIGYAIVGADGRVASGDDYIYLTNAEKAGSDWTLKSAQFTLKEKTTVSIVIMNAKAGSGAPFVVDDVELVTDGGGIDEGGDGPTPPTPPTPVEGGTIDDPFTASEALALAKTLSADDAPIEAYVKGIVSSITEVSVSFGNATYAISDDGTRANEFSIFRGYAVDGVKFVSESQIQVGDEVLVFGGIVNFKGNTPQITSGSKIISTSNGNVYLNVDHSELSAGSKQTSVSFNVVTNATSWTCKASEGASVDITSGSGNQTVTVSFPENTDTEKGKEYTVTVAAGELEVTVTISQDKASSGDELTIKATFTAGAYGLPIGSGNKITTLQNFTVDGYEFVVGGSGCYTLEQNYLLFGKKGAYIQTPAIPGYKLKSITILTGTGASTSVTAGIFEEDGKTQVVEPITLGTQNAEFTLTIAEPVAEKAYRFQVTNDKNAQAQTMTFVFVK